MRRITLWAGAILFTGLAFSSAARASLLVNGNLNTDANTDNIPDGWTSWSYGTGGYAVYTPGTGAYAEDGTAYLGAGNWSDWWTGGGGWYQIVSSSPGQIYQATVDSATESWENAYGSLQLVFMDSTGAVLLTDSHNVANYEPGKPWQAYGFTSLAAPENTAQVKFEVLTNGARGTVLFDNASLVAVPEPSSLATLVLAGIPLLRRR